MRILIRITCSAMGLIFCWFASLQLNDLDAWLWITAYGLVAILSGVAVLPSTRRFVRLPARSLAVVFTFWGLWLLGQTSGRWWDGEIEREVGGLFISALWCLTLDIISSRMSRFE
ncbi:MAG: hypothetical protein FGM33_10350 [Candidatus Kapabacteria bacterium]|nr:hypothetical protein [Candidatus Kapabacteria bacterium]